MHNPLSLVEVGSGIKADSSRAVAVIPIRRLVLWAEEARWKVVAGDSPAATDGKVLPSSYESSEDYVR